MAGAPNGSPRGIGPYALVVAAWLATRTYAVVSVDLTPWNLNDLRVYQAWLPWLREWRFPAADPMWQYPPGVAPVLTFADWLPLSFRWGFTGTMLLIDATILAILLIACARRAQASLVGAWVWSVAGILVGSILLARFDLLPTAFAVVAVLLAHRPTRSILAGIAIGVGTVVKVWPVLMLLALPRRSLGRGAAAAGAAILVALVSAALLSTGSLSFLQNQGARGLQVESVGALPYLLVARLSGAHLPTALEYGSIQVVRPGTEAVGLLVTVVGAIVLGGIAYLRLRGRLESVPPGDVGLAVVLVAIATSRVYSPQFNTWLVGLAAVALVDRTSRMRGPTVVIAAMSVLTQVIYPWRMSQLIEDDAFTTWLQAARILLLLVATGWALWALWVGRGVAGERRASVTAAPSTRPRTPRRH